MDNTFWDRSIFRGISEESKNAIEKLNKKEVTYDSNTMIIREGQEIEHFAIIIEGVLKSTEYTSSGKELNSSYFFAREQHSSYYFAGDAFPFYLIYGGVKNYFFNVLALKKSRVVWLPVDELKEIIDKDPVFLKNILQFVAKYNCYSKVLLRGVQYRKVIERLSYWLIYMNNSDELIEIPNSQEVLADMLHVNRSSLNQELVQLDKDGIIQFNRKNIRVLDKEYLKSLL
ncbi:Crp/Fnr family transcriptional regulator [Peptostreptococcus sp. D1]|uniref:Crp/Fnr family transcriptional regulator n=1 Tax=Peptostreptococcus sp. D1 TaxID=72304 RepID=UPI0008F19D54|nr:Crp/Fnr family transcriptional regulator [Peptostreptococcus sp. D1]SFE14892.1 cAMP-binding domain of CRP or a regulatory subunit of cAMP-dependent protein kinases [Peptostreptococcus sp. D1]